MPLCVAVLLWWNMCVVCAGPHEGLVCSVLFGGYGVMWTTVVVSFLWRTYRGRSSSPHNPVLPLGLQFC